VTASERFGAPGPFRIRKLLLAYCNDGTRIWNCDAAGKAGSFYLSVLTLTALLQLPADRSPLSARRWAQADGSPLGLADGSLLSSSWLAARRLNRSPLGKCRSLHSLRSLGMTALAPLARDDSWFTLRQGVGALGL